MSASGEIWSQYVRYIGAGAVATAGILTVVRNLPTMVASFAAVAKGLRGGAPTTASAKAPGGTDDRTDRDLPGVFVFGGIGPWSWSPARCRESSPAR